MTQQDIIYPPPLFETPADGWIAWVTRLMADQQQDFTPPGMETISGRLITSRAPSWAQGFALVDALDGRLTTPAATEIRQRFLAGEPLSLLPYQSEERFRTFSPQMQSLGQGNYCVGESPLRQDFRAATLGESIAKARQWFLRMREEEIGQARDAARDLGGTVGELMRDLVEAVVFRDDQIFDSQGNLIVWQNGAHDMYAVRGSDFCYGLEVSPSVAGQFALLAASSLSTRLPHWDDAEKIALLAPEGWREVSGSYVFVGGKIDPRQVVFVEDKPVGQVVYNKAFQQIGVKGASKDLLPNTSVSGVDYQVALAWAARRVVKTAQRKLGKRAGHTHGHEHTG